MKGGTNMLYVIAAILGGLGMLLINIGNSTEARGMNIVGTLLTLISVGMFLANVVAIWS